MTRSVSIIVRTKNEERWIAQCLQSVFSQAYQDFEIILVDNESTDRTLQKAKQFKISKILTCKDYLPGRALNIGIRQARGQHIASLSGHCIPVNDQWLGNLLRNFDTPEIAGVYGRQQPISFTSDADKRDLALVFGLDRRVQIKDSFFHNANSMIRKELWEKVPFDETVTNIEDRVWANQILQKNYRIIYEPEASVYHYHGIHQNGDIHRCSNVVRIMENLHKDYANQFIDLKRHNTVALIPVRGPVQYLNDKPLIAYTIERARDSRYINKVIVSTDNPELAEVAKQYGAEVPFLRDETLSKDYVDLGKVYQFSLEKLEELNILPDLLVCLEVTFPFRPKGLLDDMIVQLAQNGFDGIVAAKAENRAIWKQRREDIVQLDEGMTPRKFKALSFTELRGLGCVTHPEFVRDGNFLGEKIGIYEVDNPYSHLEVRNKEDFELASSLIAKWF